MESETKTVVERRSSLVPSSPSSIKRRISAEQDTNKHKVEGTKQPGEYVKFVRHKRSYLPQDQPTLSNSLLTAVGFLEFANAGDFAANVWNTIPVPPYALAFMVIGATAAVCICFFAAKDCMLSWRNLAGLRRERRLLQSLKAQYHNDRQALRSLDTLLDVNFRETGTEMIDRVGMDAFMGFGAMCVGVGTYMAIGGANPAVYRASNLLSGYIGNAPCALWGVANVVWSGFVWRRARRHSGAGASQFKSDDIVEKLLQRRANRVKVHAVLNGITGIVGGAGSLVSATMWWGYVILIPCITSSIVSNYLWRHRIGYDRPFARQLPKIDKELLAQELRYVMYCQRILEDEQPTPLGKLVSDPGSISEVLDFLIMNQLFQDFCSHVLADGELATALLGDMGDQVTVDSQSLVDVDDPSRLLEIAQKCVSERGLTAMKYRERNILETLGCCLCHSEPESGFDNNSITHPAV